MWSCPDCENLLGLLTDEEMIELMEGFDDLDVDCGKCTVLPYCSTMPGPKRTGRTLF